MFLSFFIRLASSCFLLLVARRLIKKSYTSRRRPPAPTSRYLFPVPLLLVGGWAFLGFHPDWRAWNSNNYLTARQASIKKRTARPQRKRMLVGPWRGSLPTSTAWASPGNDSKGKEREAQGNASLLPRPSARKLILDYLMWRAVDVIFLSDSF